MSADDSDYDSEIAEDIANDNLQKLQPKTYDVEGIERITRQWKRYCINIPSLKATEPSKMAPDIKLIRGFLKCRVKKGKTRLDEEVTIITLSKEFEQLQRAVKFKNYHVHFVGQKHDVAQYINVCITEIWN